jgi:hypothetical protein
MTAREVTIDPALDFDLHPIDWPSFWANDGPKADWLAEPILPAGRQVAIFSGAKVGKSLLALDIAAGLASGTSVLGHSPTDPIDVAYFDMEMTADDLRERLGDFGYGPDADLSHLHYYQLPSLPPLDSEAGGSALMSVVERYKAQLVVIDTMARAVRGEENSADTYRAFYAHTGVTLKQMGVTLLRLDHAGKDGTRGQRGSSGKDDDVDLVWKLIRIDERRFTLHRERSRIAWVPAEVSFERHEEPVLSHTLSGDVWPAGTMDVALLLDELAVPLDATVVAAQQALRSAGRGRRKALVIAALKHRRGRP